MRRFSVISLLLSTSIAFFALPAAASCVALPGLARDIPVIGELKLDVCELAPHPSLKSSALLSYQMSPSVPVEFTSKVPSGLQSLQDVRQTIAIDKSGLVKNFNQGDKGNVSYQFRLRGNGDVKAQVKVLFD
jgi:hypothetical protein